MPIKQAMKVATIHTLYGRRAGAEMLFEKSARGLAETYPELELTIYCNEDAARVLPDDVPNLRKRTIPALNSQFSKAWWLEFGWRTEPDLESHDVFWIPSGANSFPGRWRIPTVVTFLDLGELAVKNKYDLKRTVYRKWICIPRSTARARLFTTISDATAKDLSPLLRNKQPVRVVYPGFSPRIWKGSVKDPSATIRKETDLTFSRVIYCPCRTDYEGKGLDVLLNAYARVLQQSPDVPPLVVSGPAGQHHARFEAHLARPELRGHAHWVGRVSDECVDALYNMSDMMVLASRYEGFGFTVLEAFAHDVPVICSDAGSLPEVAGDAALLFSSEDDQGLASQMTHALRNPDECDRLRKAGKRQLSRFDWTRTYSGMFSAFQEALTVPSTSR